MLRCNEVTRLYASEDIRRASLRKRLAVRIHLMMCRLCQRYVRELAAIADAARGLNQDVSEDGERTEALVRRVLSDQSHPRR